MRLTVDASVWVASQIAADIHHTEADRCLEVCLATGARLVVPEIVLLEVAAGVARLARDAGAGQVAARKLERFPGIRFHPLDRRRLEKALMLATRNFLRAADALYLTTAREAKTTLITLDEEMLQRGAAVVTVLTPADWLKQLTV
jgi:predicted nucleic acid-binding protein